MSYEEVKARIAAAAVDSGRDPDEITLVAVSKAHSLEEIRVVYEQGHRVFGENRADEMAEKAAALPDDIQWHFVGALQSNKCRLVRPSVALLHSMDRESLAKAWVKGPGNPPPVLIQVNIGNEPQKGGVLPDEVRGMASLLAGYRIDTVGLMAIPPAPEEPDDSRPHFSRLREIRDSISGDFSELRILSMGMTDDFEVAISEGASMIRVGRAIFGPRS